MPPKKERKPRKDKGYTRDAYKFMKGGGITNIPVPEYEKITWAKYRKDNWERVKKAGMGKLNASQIVSALAYEWKHARRT